MYVSGLTYEERHLLGVCVDRELAALREACEEDQGTPDGQPGTVGHEVQARLRKVKARVLAGGA